MAGLVVRNSGGLLTLSMVRHPFENRRVHSERRTRGSAGRFIVAASMAFAVFVFSGSHDLVPSHPEEPTPTSSVALEMAVTSAPHALCALLAVGATLMSLRRHATRAGRGFRMVRQIIVRMSAIDVVGLGAAKPPPLDFCPILA